MNHPREHWDQYFREKGRTKYQFDRRRMGRKDRGILDAINAFDPAGKACLDIGFGTGRWLQYLRTSGAERLAAADISAEALESVRDFCDEAVQVDLEREALPFADASFDLVLSFEVIEHLAYPEQYLSEIRRVLKPQGLFLLSCPNLTSFGSRIRMLAGLAPNSFGDPTHLRHYRRVDLLDVLRKAGFAARAMSLSIALNPLNFKSMRIPAPGPLSSLQDSLLVQARPVAKE